MKIISHRGANLELPENTIEAFDRALEIGIDELEADVMLTKDGRLILRHDDLISINGKWCYVKDLTFDELRSIDLGRGCRMPALEDFLECYASKTKVFLDIKSDGACNALSKLLKGNAHRERIHVTSFIHAEIQELKKNCPKIASSIALVAIPLQFEHLLSGAGVKEVSLYRGYLNGETVKRLREHKIIVRVYTVNLPSEAGLFEKWGVNAIFTDDPKAMGSFRG